MRTAQLARLEDRGVVSVTGDDARSFLDNLITNDMDLLDRQTALHAGLLTPQGKIQFAFFVIRAETGYLLELPRNEVPGLLQRLTLYRLRAKVTLNDLSAGQTVVAAWGGAQPDEPLCIAFADPRNPDLGQRLVMAPEMAVKLAARDEGPAAYHRHRIAKGVPEYGLDYVPGGAFPHEANFDRLNGVSFTKGCFVGQEVVARMQHKTVVRRRIVPVAANEPLAPGAEIRAGDAVIGSVGSVAGKTGLAMIRLDRAAEAQAHGLVLMAGAATVTIDAAMLADYVAAAATP